LPDKIHFTAGHKNIYTYDAGGQKLRVVNYSSNKILDIPMGTITPLSSTPTDYIVLTTDYVGNMIYENGALKEILLPEGYYQNGTFYYYLKDHLGDNRVTINSSGAVVEKSHYYPSGTRFFTESTSNSTAIPYRYSGKEMEAMNGLNQMDYGARRRFSWGPIWTGVDPLAEKYYSISPYAYCNDNPVRLIDPNGLAWRSTSNQNTGEQTGYEWVPDDQSYNEDGSLKDGLYDQAIFFSNNEKNHPFVEKGKENMGSSDATVYLADGTTTIFDACTKPYDSDNSATLSAGIYDANNGIHHGKSLSYPALKVSDVGNNDSKVELGYPNPNLDYKNGETYAVGIDIHKAGIGNSTGKGVSVGCLLIDYNRWNEFIGLFNNSEQKSNPVSVTVSRTMAQPTNTNVLLRVQVTPVPAELLQRPDATHVAIPYRR